MCVVYLSQKVKHDKHRYKTDQKELRCEASSVYFCVIYVTWDDYIYVYIFPRISLI